MEIRDFTGNLQHTTTQLVSKVQNGTSFGTGFFFDFGIYEIEHHLKTIITNRHVMKNTIELKFVMNESTPTGHRTDKQHVLSMDKEDLKKFVFYHPDPTVDLCIVDISEIYEKYSNEGITLFMRAFSFEDVPSREAIQDLKALEQVVMIGYPAALWDEHNNLPIMRTGDTASHIAYDYKGREDFLVNIPAYHGSSGSPLVKLEETTTVNPGQTITERSALLLGIQKEIPELRNLDGSIYANLGIFVKSYRLYDFIPLVKAAYQDEINSILQSRQNQ